MESTRVAAVHHSWAGTERSPEGRKSHPDHGCRAARRDLCAPDTAASECRGAR
ncbi:hypothetical protein JYU34_012724 [Plutella xylostella]|uniref:Uncharacterized protein n=1 Tax=Plutella xylostella TaxID=51655 RepID=A0ABQ7QC47_PLUXY|nr:hypothetical protein JYU34_012724 [Plutella xylostella]